MFIAIFRIIGKLLNPLEHYRILLSTLGGLSIGLIAFAFPQTLFFSETQIQAVIETGASLGVGMLIAIAIAKMFAISFTLHSGFLGGFIFPLFFKRSRNLEELTFPSSIVAEMTVKEEQTPIWRLKG
jgi:H+/Cl- antiporter ClcA